MSADRAHIELAAKRNEIAEIVSENALKLKHKQEEIESLKAQLERREDWNLLNKVQEENKLLRGHVNKLRLKEAQLQRLVAVFRAKQEKIERIIGENQGRRQTVVVDEIRAAVAKVAQASKTETLERARQTLLKDDRNMRDLQNGSGFSTPADSDHLATFLSGEVENWKKDALSEYCKILERVQGELEDCELEKSLAVQDRDLAVEQAARLRTELLALQAEFGRQERSLQSYAALVDAKGAEVRRLNSEIDKLRAEHAFLERTVSQRIEKVRKDYEDKVEFLETSLQRINKERDFLSREKSLFADSNLSNEEHMGFLRERVEALTAVLAKLSAENELLRLKFSALKEEFEELSKRLADERRTVQSVKERCAAEIQETVLACQQRIAKMAQFDQSGDQPTAKVSELTPLDFRESSLGWSAVSGDALQTSQLGREPFRKVSTKAALVAFSARQLCRITEVCCEDESGQLADSADFSEHMVC